MSIKTVSKSDTARIQNLVSCCVFSVCYESGQYRRCPSSEILDAVARYKSAIVELQSDSLSAIRLTVTMGPSYRYQAFFDECEARRRLPERLFHDAEKHAVSNVSVLYGGDTGLFMDDEILSLSVFESRCFQWCLGHMAESEEVSVCVRFDNGKQQDFHFSLSMTNEGGVMGLSDYVNQGIAFVHQPHALAYYKERDRMSEYFLLSNFERHYRLN